MSKAYYKVVYDDNGTLKSCLYGAILRVASEFEVEYKIGEWTKPKLDGSKLFCFLSLSRARNFIAQMWSRSMPRMKIFRCKVRNPKVNSDPVSATLDQESIEYFWGKTDKAPSFYYLGGVMPCLFADEVMLTKEIKGDPKER